MQRGNIGDLPVGVKGGRRFFSGQGGRAIDLPAWVKVRPAGAAQSVHAELCSNTRHSRAGLESRKGGGILDSKPARE
jgi:hypothetical protein